MERLDGKNYRQLVKAIEVVFRRAGWLVEVEVEIGPLRADLVLRSPRGNTYIAELNLGDRSEHFASVAEISNWGKILLNLSGSNLSPFALAVAATAPVPLILAAQAMSPIISRIANQLNVELVKINEGDAELSARTVLEKLQKLDKRRK